MSVNESVHKKIYHSLELKNVVDTSIIIFLI